MAIALTGNYAFFNLLTIALCLLLIDDQTGALGGAEPGNAKLNRAHAPALGGDRPACALLITLPVNLWLIFTAIIPHADWPRTLAAIHSPIAAIPPRQRLRILSGHDEGSAGDCLRRQPDAIDWQPYEFEWKPGDLRRAPRWVRRINRGSIGRCGSPPLAVIGGTAWLQSAWPSACCRTPRVSALLAENPFPDEPPQFVRASLYQYRFTSSEERQTTGEWWKRTLSRAYLPTSRSATFSVSPAAG